MQHIVICDDNQQVMEHLGKMIDKLWTPAHVITELNSSEALERYVMGEQARTIDILLMDIRLGDINGITLSKRIAEQFPHMRVIYITGHIEYCEEIFKGIPTAFLVKPIKPERLLFALQKATRELEDEGTKMIQIRTRTGQNVWLGHSEIHYIESEGRIAKLVCQDRLIECYRKLSELEEVLSDQFLRCHQSYLVNLNFIDRMERESIHLQDGTSIPISKSKAKQTKERLLQFAGQRL